MDFVVSGFYFINKVPVGGWLAVAARQSGAPILLLEYTRIKIIEIARHRIYFEVMDGGQKGAVASLSQTSAAVYVGVAAPKQGFAQALVSYGAVEEIYSRAKRATYWQQTAILVAENVCAAVTLNTELGACEVSDAFKPIPPGTYKILVPPSPRDKTMTAVYRTRMDSSLKSDQVWFPIEYGDNSRFIHLGDVSEGSVTVMELSRWNAIYQSLVSHRSTDGRYVGQLTVQK